MLLILLIVNWITQIKKISESDIYVVWLAKTLQNNKALLSTNLFDGMYYEVTFNGDKNELYFDAYKSGEISGLM